MDAAGVDVSVGPEPDPAAAPANSGDEEAADPAADNNGDEVEDDLAADNNGDEERINREMKRMLTDLRRFAFAIAILTSLVAGANLAYALVVYESISTIGWVFVGVTCANLLVIWAMAIWGPWQTLNENTKPFNNNSARTARNMFQCWLLWLLGAIVVSWIFLIGYLFVSPVEEEGEFALWFFSVLMVLLQCIFFGVLVWPTRSCCPTCDCLSNLYGEEVVAKRSVFELFPVFQISLEVPQGKWRTSFVDGSPNQRSEIDADMKITQVTCCSSSEGVQRELSDAIHTLPQDNPQAAGLQVNVQEIVSNNDSGRGSNARTTAEERRLQDSRLKMDTVQPVPIPFTLSTLPLDPDNEVAGTKERSIKIVHSMECDSTDPLDRLSPSREYSMRVVPLGTAARTLLTTAEIRLPPPMITNQPI